MELPQIPQKSQKDIIWFFCLAYLFSWLITIPIGLTYNGIYIIRLSEQWHFLGAIGPALASIILNAIKLGKPGIKRLFSDCISIRVPSKIVILMILSPVWMFVISFLFSMLFISPGQLIANIQSTTYFCNNGWFFHLLLPALSYGIFEEMGWRGYAQPRLQARYSGGQATWIVGIFWAFWHIPAFFYRFDFDLFGIIGFLISIIMGAGILAILYNSSGGSVLAVILWHILFDIANIFAQEFAAVISIIMSFCVILFTLLLVRKAGVVKFSFGEKIILIINREISN